MNSLTDKIQNLQIRLGVRLEYVVPICASLEIIQVLEAMGYQVDINPANPDSMQANGENSQIYVDLSKRVMGVIASTTTTNAVTELKQFFIAVKERLDADLNNFVQFYEFEINYFYKVGQNVYESFSKLYCDCSDMAILNEILGERYSQTIVKLAPSAQDVHSKIWHEIAIEPKINSTGNTFIIRMICRNPSIDKATEIADKTEATITSIINRVILKR